MAQGEEAPLTLTLVPKGGFTGEVALTLGEAPPGVEATPLRVRVEGKGPTVATPHPESLPLHPHGVVLEGRGGGVVVRTGLTLTVSPARPSLLLRPSRPKPLAQFGHTLALSRDGRTLAVGAPYEEGSGTVHVFRWRDGKWLEEARLQSPSPEPYEAFGWSLALSGDGSLLAVGAPGRDGTVPNAGAVYLFSRREEGWGEEGALQPSPLEAHEGFGEALALSGDGQTLAVGSPARGRVYLFSRGEGGWREEGFLDGPGGRESRFGQALALSRNGKTLAVGAPGGIGAAYVLLKEGRTWQEGAHLEGRGEGKGFGRSLALSEDGGLLAVGVPGKDGGKGMAYLFLRRGGVWEERGRITPSGDGRFLAVGAPGEDSQATGIGGNRRDNRAQDSGATYTFLRVWGWEERDYVKAPNTGKEDAFGYSLALSLEGNLLAVGAPGEDGEGEGGAVYLYPLR